MKRGRCYLCNLKASTPTHTLHPHPHPHPLASTSVEFALEEPSPRGPNPWTRCCGSSPLQVSPLKAGVFSEKSNRLARSMPINNTPPRPPTYPHTCRPRPGDKLGEVPRHAHLQRGVKVPARRRQRPLRDLLRKSHLHQRLSHPRIHLRLLLLLQQRRGGRGWASPASRR